MYLTCVNCGEKNHISEWSIFPVQKKLIKAICPVCRHKAEYQVSI